MLQCAAVCHTHPLALQCNFCGRLYAKAPLLQCLQRVAVCYSVMHCVAKLPSQALCPCVESPLLQCFAVCCSVLQCVAVCCNNTLQHTATHFNTLQHTATHCNTRLNTHTAIDLFSAITATHCNALQHTATHCNTLQHTATGDFKCRQLLTHSLQLTTAHCNTQRTVTGATRYKKKIHATAMLQRITSHCNTATH